MRELTRREFFVTSSVVVAAASRTFGQAPGAPPVVPHFEALRNNVGVFTARGGTIGWLIAPEGIVIVDSQFADTAATALAGVKERSTRPIDALINTHHHGDHTGGNLVFRPAVGKIVAHSRVPDLIRAAAAAAHTEANQAYPDTTFDQIWSTAIGKEKVAAKYYGPAHTGGDIAITFQSANIVHLGDLLSSVRHPRADRPAGASVTGWITVLEAVVPDHDADTLYIAGHAKAGTPVAVKRADVLTFRDYLTAVVDVTRKGIAAGRSADELVGSAALPAAFATYEGSPEFVIRAAHDELAGKS